MDTTTTTPVTRTTPAVSVDGEAKLNQIIAQHPDAHPWPPATFAVCGAA